MSVMFWLLVLPLRSAAALSLGITHLCSKDRLATSLRARRVFRKFDDALRLLLPLVNPQQLERTAALLGPVILRKHFSLDLREPRPRAWWANCYGASDRLRLLDQTTWRVPQYLVNA